MKFLKYLCYPFLSVSIFILISCGASEPKPAVDQATAIPTELAVPIAKNIEVAKEKEPVPSFDRSVQLKKMKAKIKDQEPLIAHILVPLCDNENQGIVPVNARLGNGLNLQTNLYWGALYGIKTHFKKRGDWKLLKSEKEVNKDILERVVFYKTFANGAKVYLIADAYRGDRMRACLKAYFAALGGTLTDEVVVDGKTIAIAAEADLVGFNGHNGLMDFDLPLFQAPKQLQKDAVVIGCASHGYFEPHLRACWAYPLVTTANLLAPEAYVMEAIINNWANLKDGEMVRLSAGDAYNKYQKCGQKGARRLFKTGWEY